MIPVIIILVLCLIILLRYMHCELNEKEPINSYLQEIRDREAEVKKYMLRIKTKTKKTKESFMNTLKK